MSSKLQSEAAFESTDFGFLYRQFTTPKPLPSDIQLDGQTAIVTGSNIGLGLSACRQLLELGLSHLIMAVRSPTKGGEAARVLRQQFKTAVISVWPLDLESYESITEFVEKCKSLPRIDVAILNAALMKASHTTIHTTQHETTLQVNYLSTVLLSILLLPVLKQKRPDNAQRPPVLSIVGSDLAWRVDIESKGPVFEQFDKPLGYNKMLWYGRTKVLLVFFMSKLAEVVSADDVLINMPNPGTTRGTAFFRESSTLAAKLIAILQFLGARRVDVGATTYLDAALVRGKESHGCFLSDWSIKSSVPQDGSSRSPPPNVC